VLLFDYVGERDMLNEWALKKEEIGINDYWQQKNAVSLDRETIYIPEEKA